MKSFISRAFLAVVTVAATACQHSMIREPQAVVASYDTERVEILKSAVESGLYLVVPDAVMRDIPARQVGDKCRRTEESPWMEKAYSVLGLFHRQPELYTKVHFVEFRRGDRPGVDISNDLDGARYLVINYAKVQKRRTVNTLAEIPCADGEMDLIGKEMMVTEFEWPNSMQIVSVLEAQPTRALVPRLAFDRKFLVWLAERLTVFRFSQELVFEKNAKGDPLLVEGLHQMSKELESNPQQLRALEFWLKEINDRSRQGGFIKFFALKRDLKLSTGLQVDSAGNFKHSRKMQGYADPTYPFLSYRTDNGAFVFTGLPQLESCLQRLQRTYLGSSRSPTRYDTDADAFMHPGYFCQDGESVD